MPLIILIGWICLPGAVAQITNDPTYEISFSNLVVQASADVTGPYTNIFVPPTLTEEVDFIGTPPFPFYFRFQVNVVATNSAPATNVISTSLTVLAALSTNGPYSDIDTVPLFTTTIDTAANSFYRTAFPPTGNLIYIDPRTVEWVPPP